MAHEFGESREPVNVQRLKAEALGEPGQPTIPAWSSSSTTRHSSSGWKSNRCRRSAWRSSQILRPGGRRWDRTESSNAVARSIRRGDHQPVPPWPGRARVRGDRRHDRHQRLRCPGQMTRSGLTMRIRAGQARDWSQGRRALAAAGRPICPDVRVIHGSEAAMSAPNRTGTCRCQSTKPS